jgi:subtilase family serine protease
MDDNNHLVEEKEDENEPQQSITFKSLVSSL